MNFFGSLFDSLAFSSSSSQNLDVQLSPISPKMGFDQTMLRSVLESFVDEIREESTELMIERPRFAHAVVVVADGAAGELCQEVFLGPTTHVFITGIKMMAGCIRQLDEIELMDDFKTTSIDEDEAIQRALRELLESRDMLNSPRNSFVLQPEVSSLLPDTDNNNDKLDPMRQNTAEHILNEINQSPQQRLGKASVLFPSMSRRRSNV